MQVEIDITIFRQLVEKLLDLSCLSTPANRQSITLQLSKTIRHEILYSQLATSRHEVERLLAACFKYQGGWLSLLAILKHFDDKSIPWQELQTFLGEHNLTAADMVVVKNQGKMVNLNSFSVRSAELQPQAISSKPNRTLPIPPPAPTHFAGREAELTQLRQAFAVEGNMITITALKGGAGIGKTTLARKIAHDLWHEGYFGAVIWTEVKPDPTATKLLLDWAHYFDPAFSFQELDEKGAARVIRTELNRLITEVGGPTCRTLIVLDDVWEDGVAAVRVLLKALPERVSVLITTRSAMVVQQLSARPQSLAALPGVEAVSLLKQYLAGESWPLLGLDALARVLGGHALALTLAAKKLNNEPNPLLALPRHLAQYEKGLPAGSALSRLTISEDLTSREDSLEVTLTYSYKSLSTKQKTRFRALGALAYDQPFDLRLLAGLWQAPTGSSEENSPQETAREWANGLLSLSLIEAATETALGDGWYRQHPVLRSYAVALLKTKQKEELATCLRYYDQANEFAFFFFQLHDEPEDWDFLTPYLPHIHLAGDALNALYKSHPHDEDTARRALAFATNTYWYVSRRQETHKQEWLEMGLKAAQHLKDREKEGLFLNELGLYHDRRGNKKQALAYFEQSLSIDRELSNSQREATTLTNIGKVYANLGDKQKALDYYEQALPLRKASNDLNGEAFTLLNIGKIYADDDNRQLALDYYDKALPLFRTTNDRNGQADCLNNIGRIYDRFDKQKAFSYFEQALLLYKNTGNLSGEAAVLNNLSGIYLDIGNIQKAVEFLQQSLALHQRIDNRRGEAITCSNLSYILYGMGLLQEAINYMQHSVDLEEEIESPDLIYDKTMLEQWQAELVTQQQNQNNSSKTKSVAETGEG